MFPVLFSIGNFNASSFGVFLALGFLFGIFLIWRLCRAWDLDEEKALDLTLLTFAGGLIGARIYYMFEHLEYFIQSPLNLILINKVPGFNFWGGLLGGWLILFFFARRFRIDFWQLTDIALVGLLGGLIFSNIGCFLGGCNIGIPLNAFFAVSMEGVIGRRWPIQIIEALLLSLVLVRIWSLATHFHQRGKIVSLGLIYIGMIWFVLEPLKQNHSGLIFSLILIILGITTYYKVTRQNPVKQLKLSVEFLKQFVIEEKVRKKVVQLLSKSWYNQKANFSWQLRNFKKFLRRSNVKLS